MLTYRAAQGTGDRESADVAQGDVTEAVEQFIDALEASWQSADAGATDDAPAEFDAELCGVE